MDCTPNWSSPVQNPNSNDLISFLQFDFTIPHKVFLLPGTENPEGSLQLPPSFEDGGEFVDTATSKRYKQPLVLYAIQTSVTLSPPRNTHTPLRSLYAMNKIQVLPRSGAQPPSATEDFPGEFQMACVRTIKTQRCCIPWKSLAVGKMAMSTREPPPIKLDIPAPRGATYCEISVTFMPTNPVKLVGNFQHNFLNCRLRSRLRIKTYYSTQNLQQIPQRSRCSPLFPVRLRSSFIDLDTRDILMSLSPSSEARKEWMASICLPIHTPLDMTPSFTSAFAARLYALNLDIRLPDLAHEPFKLEVPLQLVFGHGYPD
ncbi:uncharacterized protein EURHEDRAFT_417554 [Aspergillus ruber CBS 135680]|uniref:Arrestin-like N-terminal domain-containing protein n=1 Tax=Aspergillus ruber (strain CBS 135680) TaxID=1388766 RepID=A0A017RZW2_ASPRC|nr:uncharacterized protein EURHEDRAFT_417554 [Aspergillus ruber CBS 135680]EYE90328.1 hypothetical protein EURHEDRAFT_417554 [Aspergillus ruber CBS 135680]